ncbi:unnamed protein product [Didymodactylos carnosus]|uniref:Uncharacterized protein n=1 Tax=Didymodactylos carnosus TaxID=1234261 RepID=A0A814U2Z6_9BILA|nr:unnamed protein product [Didymodactylos carnosus]CAF3932572.1 unnamed protein product [Didymodactylos carnosus]
MLNFSNLARFGIEYAIKNKELINNSSTILTVPTASQTKNAEMHELSIVDRIERWCNAQKAGVKLTNVLKEKKQEKENALEKTETQDTEKLEKKSKKIKVSPLGLIVNGASSSKKGTNEATSSNNNKASLSSSTKRIAGCTKKNPTKPTTTGVERTEKRLSDSSTFNDVSAKIRKKNYVNILNLPDDVLSFSNDKFYDYVRETAGEEAVEICKFQAIRSTAVLITTTIDETLAILDDNVEELKDFKRRVDYTRFDGKFVMKIGIKNRIKNLITLLKLKNEQTQITINTTTVDDQNIDSQNLYELMLSLFSTILFPME